MEGANVKLENMPLENDRFKVKVHLIINADTYDAIVAALRSIAEQIESDCSEENQRVFGRDANYSLIIKNNA